jgi:DNA polymerase-3 subunit delta
VEHRPIYGLTLLRLVRKTRGMASTVSAPVYAIIGDDSFLQMQKLAEIVAELPPDAARIEFDGERAELAEVLDELRSFAMFGGGKLVVVRNADEFVSRFRSQLEDYLADPSSSGTLVLRLESLPSNQRIYKAIAKIGKIQACAAPKGKDLPSWILNRGRTVHKLTVSLEAANLLADLIGADMGRLDNELAKLALQSDNGKLDVADVSGSVAFQREKEMWSLTDALTAGNPAEALRRWRQLVRLDASTEFRAVTWLAIWLANLRKAIEMRKKRVPDGVIARSCRIFDPRQQQPFFKTAEKLGEAGVNRAVNLLADVDLRSKSGVGEAAGNVERFILSLAI